LSTDDQRHLGIGLALGKEIIKAHDGQFWVESQLGQGSTFHFTLKAKK
jgi:signal transduction histidine kinase